MHRGDLNLLAILDTLLSEGSVTRAARRLNLTQPAVSNALGRLRALFDDPLLERSGKEMQPTRRARQLMTPLREALSKIESTLLSHDAFDPRTAKHTVRIATTDYVSAVVLPELLVYLRENSPGTQVVVSEINTRDPLAMLDSADVDLLWGSLGKTSPYVHRQDLFADKWVCVVRNKHPIVHGRMSAKQFRELPHLEVRPQHGSTGGTIDEILVQIGARRDVALSMPHLLAAPYVLLRSNLILTVASRIAAKLCADFPLQALRHPLKLKPFVVSQLWHQRTHTDAAQAWFRKVVAEVTAKSGIAVTIR